MSKGKNLADSLSKSLKARKKEIALMSFDSPLVKSIVTTFIPTSSIVLNKICGGGIPCGRLTEIYGAEASGKSSLSADLFYNVQKMGGVGIIIDSEQVFSPERAASMGVKIEDLVYAYEPVMENVFDFIEEVLEGLADGKDPAVIIWDSVAASTSLAEEDSQMADKQMAERSRILSKGLRKINAKIPQNVALVFINQIRTKIGGFSNPYSDNTSSVGGYAIKFCATLRLELKQVGKAARGEERVGILTRATVIKNKVSRPGGHADIELFFDGGLDDTNYLLTLLKEKGLVTSSGAWLSLPGIENKFMKGDFKKLLDGMEKGAREKLVKEALTEVEG